MEFAVVGWHDADGGGPRVRLDFRAFAYAGKFVTSSTGVAVARDECDPWDLTAWESSAGDADARAAVDVPQIGDPTIVGAVAFNEYRTDPETLRLRYVTVREDRRGEGLGPHIVSFVCARARERGYTTCRIAVNNAFSYEALSKAGFAYTGRETGLAEVVMDRSLGEDAPVDADAYPRGLAVFRTRDVSDAEHAFLAAREGDAPPERVDALDGN